MSDTSASERRALVSVVGAYMWWGLSAIFWKALDTVEPLDQLGFRVVSGAVLLGALLVFGRSSWPEQLTAAHVRYGVIAAVLIAVNWSVFLWAIANEQAVEAALGYFLMPLVAVGLGVFALGERPTSDQQIALVLAAVGLVWTLVVVGSVPWVAIALGSSFALYGWARKVGPWESVNGLSFELFTIAPFLLVMLGFRVASGTEIFGDATARTLILIALTGVVTVVPLVLFAVAARRASLTAVGLLQYINPTLQFLVGWQVFGEAVSGARFGGFAWIWLALAFVVRSEFRASNQPARAQRR